jgi:hypothetical protein
MANATITVLEADGTTETDVVVLDVGRQAAAASKSVAASTEDKAVLDAIAASLALLDNSISAGNELQVDIVGALPAGSAAIGKLAANSGVDIGDVDVTSIIPGTGATNLGKAIDTATGATDTGVLLLATRDDALSALTPVEGDNIQLRVDANGALWVKDNSLSAPGQAVMASSASVTMASDQTAITVGGTTQVRAITFSTDTSAYASGDLIADTQQLDGFFRITNGTGVINSINIIDEDAQGVALYIIFMSTTTSLGSENSAPNISDANLTAGFQGIVAVATTDYVTVSGTKVATIRNIGLPVKAVTGTDDIYIAVLNSTGTPTYTAAGLEMRIGVLLD